MSKIKKITDEGEMQKKLKNKKKLNRTTGTETTAKGWEINVFVGRLS